MAADSITMIKGDLAHIFVLWMNLVCGERRSIDPEMATAVCLVVYLKLKGRKFKCLCSEKCPLLMLWTAAPPGTRAPWDVGAVKAPNQRHHPTSKPSFSLIKANV